MTKLTPNDKLANKVRQALETCWDKTASANEGPQAYGFLASSFAADGKNLFEGELKLLNVMLRDPLNINMYGRYVATTYTSRKGIMVAFQPVADLDDIIELEL